MIDKIAEALHLAFRQKVALIDLMNAVKEVFTLGFLRKGFSVFLVIAECLGVVIFDTARTPMGEKLDLTGYNLVLCEEFEGTALNTDVWHARANGDRRGGYNADSQIKVNNGKLILSGEYLENGEYGAGWYAGMIALNQKYKQGYFEIRCIVNDSPDFWSAFWIQADHPYDHYLSKGGVGGAELDIFESMEYDALLPCNRNAVTQTIHCNGSDDDVENIDSCRLGAFKGNNIYKQYNTYGLKWTQDEYIFYLNGVETARSSFASGVSQEPEEVIVSLEIPEEITLDRSVKTQYIVDYVKIWQTAQDT